jgi:hypothetical protein
LKVKFAILINLHEKDLPLLESIQAYIGGIGRFAKHGKTAIQYTVTSKEELKVILDHFDKYPLITQKRADYLLFKRALDLFNNKEHLTKKGMDKIVAIKASINLGLNGELKLAFPDIVPVTRPLVENTEIPIRNE